jgi:hypothetical protein
MRATSATAAVTAQILVLGAVAGAPASRADSIAYLVNVTVRPGYNFPDAASALKYGYGLCDRVAQGLPFAQLVSNTMADFSSTDEYQANYLISQAVNELCPQLIWYLRNSAANYVGPAS